MDPKAQAVVSIEHDLRTQIANTLRERCDWIVNDAIPMLTSSSLNEIDADYCRTIGRVLVLLMACSVNEGELSPNDESLLALRRVAFERSLPLPQVFRFTYAIERAVLDNVAHDRSLGAPTEPWPLVAQLVRRASFDMLSAYSDSTQLEARGSAFIDGPTALCTRALFDLVLAKELAHAARTGQPVSLILFSVDHLSWINEDFGRGVGDQVLVRVGSLIQRYFRGHDWVAKHSDRSIAVLLPSTGVHTAEDLAERVRNTVAHRLEFTDHRTGRQVSVTVSAAVVDGIALTNAVADPDRLMAELEALTRRARVQERNTLGSQDQ